VGKKGAQNKQRIIIFYMEKETKIIIWEHEICTLHTTISRRE